MRVYTDESVSPAIARGLRRRGLEALDAREKDNIGLTDEEQLKYVKDKGLILFTYDDDFVRIVREHCIILFVREGGFISKLDEDFLWLMMKLS